MKFENIKELINIVSDKELSRVDIEKDGFKISIRKENKTNDLTNNTNKIHEQNTVVDNQAPINNARVDIQDENNIIVKSPIVGTFYSAPSPEEEDYVRIGDKVTKGKTLCIIEAMKLMNDIEAEVSGEIVEIMVNNEETVEYNQPLFKIKP